jgi:hypothetical protein
MITNRNIDSEGEKRIITNGNIDSEENIREDNTIIEEDIAEDKSGKSTNETMRRETDNQEYETTIENEDEMHLEENDIEFEDKEDIADKRRKLLRNKLASISFMGTDEKEKF